MTTNSINNRCLNDFLVTKDSNGTIITKTISETSDSAGSYAEQNIKVAGTSSGDAWAAWAVGTTNQFALGIDNSDSDRLKLNYAASGVNPSSAAQIMNFTTAGEITKPLQPCFLATKSAYSLDVTGDGTEFVIISDTERIDQNGDYAHATGIFTAPVTGRYLLGGWGQYTNNGSSTQGYVKIVTSIRSYYGDNVRADNYMNPSKVAQIGVQSICDMDAADTAYLTITLLAATKTTHIAGRNTEANSYFYGVLRE